MIDFEMSALAEVLAQNRMGQRGLRERQPMMPRPGGIHPMNRAPIMPTPEQLALRTQRQAARERVILPPGLQTGGNRQVY